MQVVIDTNVLVAGILNPVGGCGRIVDMIITGQITPVFDDRIIQEYEMVLKRKKFNFPINQIQNFLQVLHEFGLYIIAPHAKVSLTDPDDVCFYECALVSESKILITGNRKHYPGEKQSEIKIFTPSEFMDFY